MGARVVSWLSCVVVVGLLWASGASAGSGSRFSAKELKLLAKGELVQRPVVESRGELRLIGGTSWQVIDAPPSVVWQALLDTRRYHRMLPQLAEAKLVRRGRDARKVWFRHAAGPLDMTYTLDMKINAGERDINFRIDDSRDNSIRAAWGFYTVRPYEGGRSLLVYAIRADIGDGLGKSLVRSTVHEWMLKVPWMIKRFVEGSGRWIYKPASQVAAR
ncbi:MAG: SRPBCC family protein [Myxococcales bacterium]|nr:SRPBCC family protein [Myxococcales bacterium]